MTDKEQIIVGGVDVSGCGHLVDKEACGSMDCQSVECERNPNCLFKQLAHKTQECDALESLKDFHLQKIEVLEQECEELKEYIRMLEFKNTTSQNCNQQLNSSMTKANCYRKALEEIEELISNDAFIRCPIYDDEHCNYGTSRKILDIINKTKGEE